MAILLINSAEPEVRNFVEPIENILRKNSTNYITVEYGNLLITKVEDFDSVIISGSPQGDDIIESHQPFFQWIKTFKKPILGICAGHHIIGYMFGAAIYNSQEIECGEIEINVLKPSPIFNNLSNTFKGIAMHNDSISVPEGFELIASTQTCNNQAMKKRDLDWYTLQFHPEIENPEIILNFIDLIYK